MVNDRDVDGWAAELPRSKVREEDESGLKNFRRLRPMLGRPHEVGCARVRTGNRTLHCDGCCEVAHLYRFNSLLVSPGAL